MVDIRPFKGLRANKKFVKQIASLPYDVMNSAEARELVQGNEKSFLHIVKPEIDLDPEVDLHADVVYQQAKKNLDKFINNQWLIQDDQALYYIYKQKMGEHEQLGIVAGASAQDYRDNLIKKHELTRKDKEADRIKHVDILNANTGPVFITYKAIAEIDQLVAKITEGQPEYDFVAEDGIAHILWLVEQQSDIDFITKAFEKIPHTYIADGHHRSASGTIVAKRRAEANPNHRGDEEYNYFLSVIFPHNQMKILDYNRAVKDLNGLDYDQFINKVSESFQLEKMEQRYKPQDTHQIGMYLKDQWYKLVAKDQVIDNSDEVKRLDVQILYDNILEPILKIGDPRTDNRINFVGGIRGLEELERIVDNGDYAVAFAMYPTSIEELMAIADADKIMPPKSTWFEPKLRSGLVTHLLVN